MWRGTRSDHPLGRSFTSVCFLAVLTIGFLTPFPSHDWGWVTLVALLFFTAEDFRAAARRPFLWMFTGLALLSSLWSPGQRSLEAALALGADFWLGLCLARRYSPTSAARLALLALAVTLSMHLVGIFCLPEEGLGPTGQWKGFLPHKNALGRTASLALLLALLLPASRLSMLYRVPALVLAITMLVGSDSMTPTVVVCFCLVVMLLVRGLLSARHRIATTVLALATLGLLASRWRHALNLLDRSPALSGRVKLWSANLRWASESPWWGHGFAHMEPPAFEKTVHSHNGVLSQIVQLGLVGCLLFLWDAAWCFLAGLRQLRNRPLDFQLAAPLLYLLFFFAMNLVEVTPPGGGHFSEWVLYAAATQFLVQGLSESGPSDARSRDSSVQQ